MPLTIHFHPAANLVIAVHVGIVPDEEFLSTYKALYEDPRFDTSLDQLIDLRQADSSARSSETLQALAGFMRKQLQDVTKRPRVAVIAPQDVSFGLARMYEAFTDSVDWEFVIFREPDAALAWLGLPEDLADNPQQEIRSRDVPDTGQSGRL